jgi:hypothetical protein
MRGGGTAQFVGTDSQGAPIIKVAAPDMRSAESVIGMLQGEFGEF